MNDLAIAVGIGIDKSGEQYRISVQVADPGEVATRKGTSGRTPVVMYQETGNTVLEAIRRMNAVAPRKIYFSHLRIAVIGEELAKEGISKTLDFLSRDQELRSDFYLVVAKETSAENVLKILASLEKLPATKMFNSLETSEKAWAPTVSITLDKLISDLVSEVKGPVLTGIKVKGEQKTGERKENVERIDSPAQLQYSGIAIFKKDKLVGWLNEQESKGYSNFTDKLDSTVIEVPCLKGGKLGVEVIRSETKVKGKVANGKPKVDVMIRTEADVAEVACHIDLSKSQTIYDLETEVEKAIKGQCESSVKKAKKLKIDIFGFGEAIHRADPKAWKKIKKDGIRNWLICRYR
ncbi:Ger(x)C family spore germination protein [Ammoniphilus sp. 3BR4]|uniref:Ger(x)C family spore germination protein n=1 Tax=Ammoniphilus sp. 3BR4 TaxID=3158265 RepID=UPI0034669556